MTGIHLKRRCSPDTSAAMVQAEAYVNCFVGNRHHVQQVALEVGAGT